MTAATLVPTPKLSPKALRTVDRLLRSVLKRSGSYSQAEVEKEPRWVLNPTVQVNGEVRHLTPRSLDSLVAIGEQIFDSFQKSDVVAGPDMWNAVVEGVQAQATDPRSTTEFIERVVKQVRSRIGVYSYRADIEGVVLSDIESLPLGRVRIEKRDERILDALAPRFTEQVRRKFLSRQTWFYGQYVGTEMATGDQFAHDAIMTSGILGIAACIRFQDAFSAMRSSVHVTDRDTAATATVVRWEGDWGLDNKWAIERRGGRGQPIAITREFVRYLFGPCQFGKIVSIIQSGTRTELEESIGRAIYWFARAQRDSEPAVAMLTLWTVIEAFFSTGTDEISENLADGLAKTLTFGPTELFEQKKFADAKGRIKKLYAKRCKATHRAEFRHVDASELNYLGQLAAFCVVSFVIAAAAGHPTLDSARKVIESLAVAAGHVH